MLTRLRLVLARRKRLALGCGELCLLSGSCRCFLCLLTVCHLQVKRCVNAPPSGLPIPDPYCITSSVCLLIAQSHCSNHFVLHDSRRDRLPRFPCLPPTSCDRGTRLLLANCLEVEHTTQGQLPLRCFDQPSQMRSWSQRVAITAHNVTLRHLIKQLCHRCALRWVRQLKALCVWISVIPIKCARCTF
jgi:hypothetical protein